VENEMSSLGAAAEVLPSNDGAKYCRKPNRTAEVVSFSAENRTATTCEPDRIFAHLQKIVARDKGIVVHISRIGIELCDLPDGRHS
jgi:hypothetical protein